MWNDYDGDGRRGGRRSGGRAEAAVATAVLTGAAARRERGRREMREAILAATQRLVAEQGLDALTMRAVAREIGYSVAALYEYFPAKEDILACLFFEGTEGLTGRMRSALAALPAAAPAREKIAALGRAYRAYAHEQRELFRLVFAQEVPRQGPPPGKEDSGGFDLLVGVAREGIERGEFAPVPPPVLAMAAWAKVHGFVMLEFAGHLSPGALPLLGLAPKGDDPATDAAAPSLDELFEEMLRLAMEGLLRRPG
jgi:AcrR family transcriptional regulator